MNKIKKTIHDGSCKDKEIKYDSNSQHKICKKPPLLITLRVLNSLKFRHLLGPDDWYSKHGETENDNS